jgi:hypothetical protein
MSKRFEKATRIIAPGDVAAVFNDEVIRRLAEELPPNADLGALSRGVREAVRILINEAHIPTRNELHDEIAELWKAADGRQHELAADRLERLSPAARNMLGKKHLPLHLPSPDALRDPGRRDGACAAIASLCQFGGRSAKGPPSKGTPAQWRPLLYAPTPRRNFPKRDPERNFVMHLSLAWLEATGKVPPHTARHQDDSRKLGPFGRVVRECLGLVGLRDADVVELINELHRRRRAMERRAGRG